MTGQYTVLLGSLRYRSLFLFVLCAKAGCLYTRQNNICYVSVFFLLLGDKTRSHYKNCRRLYPFYYYYTNFYTNYCAKYTFVYIFSKKPLAVRMGKTGPATDQSDC